MCAHEIFIRYFFPARNCQPPPCPQPPPPSPLLRHCCPLLNPALLSTGVLTNTIKHQTRSQYENQIKTDSYTAFPFIKTDSAFSHNANFVLITSDVKITCRNQICCNDVNADWLILSCMLFVNGALCQRYIRFFLGQTSPPRSSAQYGCEVPGSHIGTGSDSKLVGFSVFVIFFSFCLFFVGFFVCFLYVFFCEVVLFVLFWGFL